ncbi:MAG: MalY/PatB family protein [Marinifilaceae bacterium]
MQREEFERIVGRKDLPSYKWNPVQLDSKLKPDLLSFSVADMEYPIPDFIQRAMDSVTNHGVLGYEYFSDELREAVGDWFYEQKGVKLFNNQISFGPNLLNSLVLLLEVLTEPGEGVIIQTPVYYPYRNVIRSLGLEVVENKLLREGDKYQIDFDDLRQKASRQEVKVLLISNPHNPIGRVWTKKELEEIVEICSRNGIYLISDEIFSDIVFGPTPFYSSANIIGPEFQDIVTLYSAGKSFNLSGNTHGITIFHDELLKKMYEDLLNKFHLGRPNVYAQEAMLAAFQYGKLWLGNLLEYLQGNVEFISDYLRKNNLPIGFTPPQGGYLAWLDFSHWGFKGKQLETLLHDHSLLMEAGRLFSFDYADHARLNFACSQAMLKQGLDRLKNILDTNK